jgi:hypothetical protein
MVKSKLLFACLILHISILHGQQFSNWFSLHEENSLNCQIDSIDSLEFYYSKPLGIQLLEPPNKGFIDWDSIDSSQKEKFELKKLKMDSVFSQLRDLYPASLVLTDSCLILKAKDTTQNICKNLADGSDSYKNYYFEKFEKDSSWFGLFITKGLNIIYLIRRKEF